jgi:hypothetical protein
VRRYLAAFGPATAVDMQTWCGLKDMKSVIERFCHELVAFRDERKRQLFDLPSAPRPDADVPAPARFLPAFDNLVLAHSDRTRVLADAHRAAVITKNLRVNPTFLFDGFVAGTWTIERKRSAATLRVKPFQKLPKTAKGELTEAGEALLRFAEEDAATFAVRFER